MSLIVFAFNLSACQASERHWFFCDYLGIPFIEKSNHTNTVLDRVFSYKKSKEGWTAVFLISGDYLPAEIKNKFLYGHTSSGPLGSDAVNWQGFDVYRFNIETKKLIKSHVYYAPKADYERNLKERQNNPYAIPYSKKPLDFIKKEIPDNYVKYGFDKSEWQCQKLSHFMYLLRRLERELVYIFAI